MVNGNMNFSGKTPVRSELIKQLTLIAVIAAIAVWQSHFVIQAATADVYIFALLFGTAFFGFYNTIQGTYSLKKEFLALEALKQVHEDKRREITNPMDQDRLLAERFATPAVVYDPPKALATAHKLIYAELHRNGTISIPPATMQVLVSDLEAKLDERQGMAHYLGALMVLLGLLGTFIGLMHTLESVGGILGSLDLSGNGGTGAIASLIESLKKPLEGMSTGFGASLFGLIGSLVIGVLSKFDSKVAHQLQHDFETWLRNTVQIEGARQNSGEEAGSNGRDGDFSGNWRTVLQVARNTVLATSKLSTRQEELTDGLVSFREQFVERERSWERHFLRIVHLLEDQSLSKDQMRSSVESLRNDIHEMNEQVCMTIGKGQRVLDSRLVGNQAEMERNSLLVSRMGDLIGQMTDQSQQIIDHLRAMTEQMQANPAATSASNEAADPTDALVADLEHLIAAMRLKTEDVVNVRKLSRLMEDATRGGPNEDGREQNEMGVA